MTPYSIIWSHDIPSPRGQQGATLLMALIFLLVLTMLGLASAQNSVMEERMAGNTRNRDLALQSAEAALNHVYRNLSAGQNIRALTFGSAGLLTYSATRANDVAYWNAYTWDAANARQITLTLQQVDSQPWYVVEKMPTVAGAEYYRATARGVGKDSSAVVILQAMYKYTP